MEVDQICQFEEEIALLFVFETVFLAKTEFF